MLEVNATLHVLQICVIEKKKEMCAEVTFVQQIGNAMCSFTYSHEYLQLASNAILLKKRKKKSQVISRASSSLVKGNISHFLPLCCLGSFTWTVFDSLSPPRCTRVHSGGPMNKNAMSTRKEERKSPLRAVSDFPFLPLPSKASKKFTFLT